MKLENIKVGDIVRHRNGITSRVMALYSNTEYSIRTSYGVDGCATFNIYGRLVREQPSMHDIIGIVRTVESNKENPKIIQIAVGSLIYGLASDGNVYEASKGGWKLAIKAL